MTAKTPAAKTPAAKTSAPKISATDRRAGRGDVKAATTVANILRHQILNGTFAPGQRLIEADLLEDLDVSRSTLREALLHLDSDGLVELRHQRGASVTRLSVKEMADLFGVRERLEGYAAYLAAQNIDSVGNREWLLSQRDNWMRTELLSNERKHMEENIPFHEGIIRLSDNDRLIIMLRRLQIPSYRQRFLDLLGEDRRQESIDEHLNVIEAILAGNADKAERLMRRHVQRAGELALRVAT